MWSPLHISQRKTVLRNRTRTSCLASKLTYFSSIKSNVSNYVQLHVRQKGNCHLPYRIAVDTVYRFEIGFDLDLNRKTLFRKKWVSVWLFIAISECIWVDLQTYFYVVITYFLCGKIYIINIYYMFHRKLFKLYGLNNMRAFLISLIG